MKNIIACHVSDGRFVSFNGTDYVLSTFKDFKPLPNTFYVFYCLNQAVAVILRDFLPDYLLKSLHKDGTVFFQGYRISFMPYKYFRIKGVNYPEASFYDMSQYYETEFTPRESIESTKLKAKQAWETATEIYKTALNLELNPDSLVSPINMLHRKYLGKYKKYGDIKSTGFDFPTVCDLPDRFVQELSWYAYQCCHGGWTEAYKKGYFPDVYDLDINNAYGSAILNLMDTRYGEWDMDKRYIENAKYGFALCEVKLDKPFHCILVRGSDGLQYTPTGKFQIILTKSKIDFILKYQIGEVKILHGFWWIPSLVKYPYKSMMYWLWNEREKVKGTAKTFIKRCITGISGKLSEIYKNGEMGDIYNPVYRAIMEDEVQVKLASYILDNKLENNLLYIATDGILLDCPPKNLKNSTQIGEWKLSRHSSAIVLSSGLVAVKGKEGSGGFSLDFDWLLKSIQDNPLNSTYSLHKYSPLTLGKAIQESRLSELGNVEQITRTLDITYEVKRAFTGRPRNGQELLDNKYTSLPWDISIVKPLTNL